MMNQKNRKTEKDKQNLKDNRMNTKREKLH